MKFKRIAALKSTKIFQEYCQQLGIDLPFDEEVGSGPDSPLAQSITTADKFKIGNRFCVLPMEGWDGTEDGLPTPNTIRRWERFGESGAKLIWGGEAMAVRHDGRANPNQLVVSEKNLLAISSLLNSLVSTHKKIYTTTKDLYVGLQLTHSGRFSRPNDRHNLEAQTLYKHDILDQKFKIDPAESVMSDDEIDALIGDFIKAAVLASRAGFRFVDIKHCHGYLGHEFLSAYDRPGKYGGSLENRLRFLREIAAGIRAEVPELQIGVRLSAFDLLPFKPGDDGIGIPDGDGDKYKYAFGGDTSGTGLDLSEPNELLAEFEKMNIQLVCVTAGSPYYNPHIQRPALFPPSDGYQPPEDPLVSVCRQIEVVGALKKKHPNLILVGSGYSYLQEYLPNVAQAVVRTGMADSVGLGRSALSYPRLPDDIIQGRELARKLFCRTFSDCTTAPRNGIISGCFPLDSYYKQMPEAQQLKALKKETGKK